MKSIAIDDVFFIGEEKKLLVIGSLENNIPAIGADVSVLIGLSRVPVVVVGTGNQEGKLLLSLKLVEGERWLEIKRLASTSIASSQPITIEFC